MKVWQTEISRPSDGGFLPGIENGLSWAARYNKYLTKADVNAFLWWAGAQPNWSSETLIGIDDDRESCSFTKRYETFGNFTRYIKEGSIRVDIPTSGLPKNIDLSAYKHGNEYVIVMINPNNEMVASLLTLENMTPTGKLQRIVTDADNRWLETPEVEMTDNAYILELPPMSVVTFIGKAVPL
ncbi:MAG: hypothetical protein LIP01_10375 [Tannerellaceae bacterium]|nr:hypothetical protein [Tannerellaceae bacterium]